MAEERVSVYGAQIPPSVQPGQTFQVQLPNNNKYTVRCPPDGRPGERFQMHPYRVVLPRGVKSKKPFTAIINGVPVSIKAPKKAKAGHSMIVYAPVFQNRQPPAQNQAPTNNEPADPKVEKEKDEWEKHLKQMQQETPDISEELVGRSMAVNPDDIPNEFICPISQEIMAQPVVAIDGNSYDRESIERWFKQHDTSPKTNEKLPSTLLIPNRALRCQIIDFLEHCSSSVEELPFDDLKLDETGTPAKQQLAITSRKPDKDEEDDESSSSSDSEEGAGQKRCEVKVVEMGVRADGGDDLVCFDTRDADAMTAMHAKSFTVPLNKPFKRVIRFKVSGKDSSNLKMFVIAQNQTTGDTQIVERLMGNFQASKRTHEWVDEEAVEKEAGHIVADFQFLDDSGKIYLECSQQYDVA